MRRRKANRTAEGFAPRSRRRNRREHAGGRRPCGVAPAFTLVEIIMVVVILAIIAAMVVPYAVGTSSFEAMAAARLIASDLEYAQSAAITTQAAVTVTFFPTTESYRLSNASGVLIHPINKEEFVVNFGSEDSFERLDVVSASFNGTEAVTFDAIGSPDNSGSVTLRAGPHTYRVDVAAATGKVTVTAVGP